MPCDKTASKPIYIPTKLTHKNKIIHSKTTTQILRIFKNAKMEDNSEFIVSLRTGSSKKSQYGLTKFYLLHNISLKTY